MSASRIARHTLAATLLLFVAACGGSSDTPEANAPAETTETAETMAIESAETNAAMPMTTGEAAELTPEQAKLIERAVRLSKAIENDPNAAVSLLAEEGLTPEQWSKMLEDIARDPVLAAAHEAAMK